MTDEEDEVLQELFRLLIGGTGEAQAQRPFDSGTVETVLDMPFLRSVGPGDAQAVRSLANIAWEDRAALEAVLEHPSLAGGITDELTPVIAALWGAHRHNPGLVTALLDPGEVSIESRSIELAFTGKVDLHILRLGNGETQGRQTSWRRRSDMSRPS